MTGACLRADTPPLSRIVTFLPACLFPGLIYPAVNTHPSASMRPTHILMDILAPSLLSHATTLNLISFHKQLMVDTVQIASLSLQPHFIFFSFFFSSFFSFFREASVGFSRAEMNIWKIHRYADCRRINLLSSTRRKISLCGVNRLEVWGDKSHGVRWEVYSVTGFQTLSELIKSKLGCLETWMAGSSCLLLTLRLWIEPKWSPRQNESALRRPASRANLTKRRQTVEGSRKFPIWSRSTNAVGAAEMGAGVRCVQSRLQFLPLELKLCSSHYNPLLYS